ncbi:bifunctional 2-C-methyl-D-erythritol 4-phosphate cytidylyltransferase/2-C-methyl-D-erythritol 2,4-cyclodiphosphate synthase [Maricaulis sp. CAU 1757]
MRLGAVIVAAGRGERAGGGIPKQFRALAGRSVLARTLATFHDHPAIDALVVVVNPDDSEHLDRVADESGIDFERVRGGATRTASVRAGLDALRARNIEAVLIHDAARPFVSTDLIDRLASALHDHGAVLPVLPSTDALLDVRDGRMRAAIDREPVHAAQTPQAFRLAPLLAAYDRLGERALADDASVALEAGMEVHTVSGETGNFKLTRPEDFQRAEQTLSAASHYVTGQGFDVHRLERADSMWLCGVEIRAGLGLVGHSDADVGLHAVTDAVLGCAGAGDIGQHFPPSDPQWAGASSDRFLRHAVGLLARAGGTLVHADLTLIGERPKVGPYREAMRRVLADLLGLPPARVNIKATTTEKLGFTGRGEGLAAQAIVTARMTP